jgi:hypothetical protein
MTDTNQKRQIDLAVLGKKLFTISKTSPSHLFTLAVHKTSVYDFYNTFFNGNTFNISTFLESKELIKIDGATLEDGSTLHLYNKVIECAILDLEIPESAITSVSKIELLKECSNLNMTALNVSNALLWSDIVDKISSSIFIITCVLSNANPLIQNILIQVPYDCSE